MLNFILSYFQTNIFWKQNLVCEKPIWYLQTYNYLLHFRNKQLFSAQIPLFEGGNNSQNIIYNKIIK